MPSLTTLICTLGLIVLLLPLFKRLHLGIFAAMIVVGILCSPAVFDLQLIPLNTTLAAPLQADALYNLSNPHLLHYLGGILLFLVGLHLQPLYLVQHYKTITQHTLLIWGLLASSVLVGLSFIVDQTWPILISMACMLALAALHTPIFVETTRPTQSSSSSGSPLPLWLSPLRYGQIILFVLLSFVLVLWKDDSIHLQQLAYAMGFIMLLSGGFLAVRAVLNPLTQWAWSHHAIAFYAVILLFLLSLLWIGLQIGLSVVLIGLACGLILTESAYGFELRTKLQPYYPVVAGLFLLLLASQLPWQMALSEGLWVIGIIGTLLIARLCLIMAWQRWQKQNWQSTLQRVFQLHGAAELACLMLITVGSLIFSISLQQQLIMLILSYVLSAALLHALHHVLIQPAFHYFSAKQLSHNTASFDNISEDHALQPDIVILGFGRVGQIIGRMLQLQQRGFYLVDNNELDYQSLNLKQVKIIQGDASKAETLAQIPWDNCRLVILTVDDIEDSLNIARFLRLSHPNLHIIARARDRAHAHVLTAMGISEVWRETYASALALSQQVFRSLGVDETDIDTFEMQFKQHDAALFKLQQQHDVHVSYTSTQYNEPLAELKWLFEADATLFSSPPSESIHMSKVQQSSTE